MAYDQTAADALSEIGRLSRLLTEANVEVDRLRAVLDEIISISRRTPRRVLRSDEQPSASSVALTKVEDIAILGLRVGKDRAIASA